MDRPYRKHPFSVFSAIEKLKEYVPSCDCFRPHETLDHIYARFLRGEFQTEVAAPQLPSAQHPPLPNKPSTQSPGVFTYGVLTIAGDY